MKSQMTVGKKLTLSFAVLVALTLGIGYSSWRAIRTMGTLLDLSTSRTARKIEIGGNMQAAAFDMRATARAILLSAALKDKKEFEAARQKFRENGKILERLIAEIRPYLSTDRGRKATDQIQSDLPSWLAVVEETGRLCQSDKILEADHLRRDKQRPIADRIAAAAKEIIDVNKEMLANSAREGAETESYSLWIASILTALSVAVGFVVFFVVHRVSTDLRQISTELWEGAGQTASAAAQVSAASQSLAKGASDQAAALEETSASSEEINAMACKNSESTKTVANLMTSTREKFVQTNALLANTVSAMGEIHAQSGKISKIIRVIDEIAFQTNILALNAAVEAARAGEAGMGFAVVADEVRNLAQRCAQAARETADLIEESIAKSNDGRTKVDQVAEAIRTISEEAGTMNMLVEEVNLASQEQSQGIGQIGGAIVQMEQVTQANAASAEESASAAEELNAQSEALKQIVERLTAAVGANESHQR